MEITEHRSFATPDETRPFPNGRAEVLHVGGGEVGRLTFEPGWRWSNDVKPIAGTQSCEAPHFQYHAAGRLAIKMDDGTEFVAGPGDVTALPSGHDAWVVGDEPVVVVDWFGAGHYATNESASVVHTSAATLVDSFNAAWNDHDLDAALAMISVDCVFEATSPPPDGTRYVGREDIREAWAPIFDDPQSRFTVESSVVGSGHVVQQWRYDWADGHIRGIDLITVGEGKITAKLAYVKG